MAKVTNTDNLTVLRDEAGLQLGFDDLPTELAKQIVPTIELNSRLVKDLNWVRSGSSAATGTITVATGETTRDCYICAAFLSVNKDAACDAATGGIGMAFTDQYGASRQLISIATITLTAQSGEIAITLPHPIKIKRGTTVTISGTFTAGAMFRIGSIFGYYSDSSNV